MNEKEDIGKFISSLNKTQCVVLDINLSEFEAIINDAYNTSSHIIYEKILSRSDWRELDIESRSRVINDIRKNFDQLYDEILKKYYKGIIPPGGIRQILEKKFFIELEKKLILSDPEDLMKHIALNQRIEDLINYLSSVKAIIKQKCTVPDKFNLRFDDSVIKEI